MENKKITLVLLPGLNGTAGLFEPLLSVASDEFSLMVIDYSTDAIKSYETLTAEVLEKVRDVESDFILVGESFSGPIAISLSAENIPGHIGTILVATFVSNPYFSIFRYLPWVCIFHLAKPFCMLAIRFGKKTSLFKAASMELKKVKPEVLAERAREALSVDVSNALTKVKIPMAYFKARYDVVVPSWNLKKIIAIKPNIEVISFNTQHFLLQSSPHAAWHTIGNLCRKFSNLKAHPTDESAQ